MSFLGAAVLGALIRIVVFALLDPLYVELFASAANRLRRFGVYALVIGVTWALLVMWLTGLRTRSTRRHDPHAGHRHDPASDQVGP